MHLKSNLSVCATHFTLKMMPGTGMLIFLQAFTLLQSTVKNTKNGCGFRLII